jgi:hypothetical protein
MVLNGAEKVLLGHLRGALRRGSLRDAVPNPEAPISRIREKFLQPLEIPPNFQKF